MKKIYQNQIMIRVALLIAALCSFSFSQEDSLLADSGINVDTNNIRTNIAILSIKHSGGISKGEADLITDRLNIELFNTDKVNMIERNELSGILKEQGFQQSGACAEDACLVEVGQVLGVRKIISGSVGRLGSLVIINLRMIDVSTGEITAVVSRDINGELSQVIKYLPNIACELIGIPLIPMEKITEKLKPDSKSNNNEVVKKKVIKPSKNASMVDLRTIPDKATVYLNGVKVGLTPFVDNTLLPGKYKITIKKERYESYTEDFELYAGGIKKIGRNLIYKYSVMNILSKPKGATITLNNKIMGKTPFYTDTLIPDEYKIKLFLKEYKPVEDKFTAIKNNVDTISYNLFSEKFILTDKQRKRAENKGRRMARRVIFTTLAAASYGTGIYFNYQVKNSLADENTLYDRYNEEPTTLNPISPEEYARRYQDYQDAVYATDNYRLYRNIAHGTGGLFSFFFVISIPF